MATTECGSLNERNGIGILVAFNYSTSEGMNFQLRCGFKEKITYYTSLDLRITRIVTNVHCYSTNNAANHSNYLTSISTIYGGHQGRERIPRNFGPPTDDEPFRYEFAAPLGT